MNYTSLDIFKGIDLTDSFVLFWELKDNCLTFDLEASVWPESPYYSKPKKDEYTCYKNVRLYFKNIESIQGLKEMNQVNPSTDKSCELDYGNINSLSIDDEGFKLEGDFGEVTINGGEINFEFYRS
ncbi:MAG: hypothetical protein COA86_01020 [Kangiella sp.]|nr:MAG: hypothetical protein COA86_01020 [Kangiella sp.]